MLCIIKAHLVCFSVCLFTQMHTFVQNNFTSARMALVGLGMLLNHVKSCSYVTIIRYFLLEMDLHLYSYT